MTIFLGKRWNLIVIVTCCQISGQSDSRFFKCQEAPVSFFLSSRLIVKFLLQFIWTDLIHIFSLFIKMTRLTYVCVQLILINLSFEFSLHGFHVHKNSEVFDRKNHHYAQVRVGNRVNWKWRLWRVLYNAQIYIYFTYINLLQPLHVCSKSFLFKRLKSFTFDC